ncbi:hypothetical protein K777_10035, partial [Campylobacter coli CVM 41970]
MLFVHSPKAEKDFVSKGFGVDRTPVMYNDFIIIADKSLAPKFKDKTLKESLEPVSYTHLRAHETPEHLVCRLLLEKKKKT